MLREERKLRVFENKVLRRIFGPKGDEVTRDWRKKLHNEELNDVYTSPLLNLHKAYVKYLNLNLYYQQLHLIYLCNLARY